MTFLDRMEKRFGHWAVPNLPLGLVIAQVLVYALLIGGQLDMTRLALVPAAVLDGQIWRLVSFAVMPPGIADGAVSALFLAIFWYIFWMVSSSVERAWGVFRFNVYLFSGIFFTALFAVIGQLIAPDFIGAVSPDFLFYSVFFAFAVLYPNVEFYLFFVLPVKVKWLAMLSGVLMLLSILGAPSWGARIALLGPVVNFFLFFRAAMIHSVKARKRRNQFHAENKARASEAFHTCSVCGATDQTHPERHFRYKTAGGEVMAVCDSCRKD